MELGLVELPTRPRSEYTAKVRRDALIAADGGSLELAADLTRAAMTEHGYARGIISDLTNGLLGLPRTFIGRADMIAELDDTPERVGQWRQMFPEPDAIRLMAWGVTLGVGIGQMRRKYREPGEEVVSVDDAANGSWRATRPVRPVGAPDLRTLRTWDPRFLRHDHYQDEWWLMTADGEIRINPNDGEWLLYTPYGPVKPWEYGAWKSMTLAFTLARDAMFDRSRHAEVLAPVRVGKVPQGTTERQRARYLEQIRTMQRMHVFVLPPGLEYSIVESTGRVADIYKAIIEWAERDIAMLTGAIITATGSAGFSKGDVQERFTRSILSAFGGSLSTCLYDGGMVPWGLANYGTADVPRSEFDTEPPEDKKVRAETIKVAGDALATITASMKEHGFKLTASSVEKYTQSLGFEIEPLPAGDTPVAKLVLGVDGVNALVKGSEGRASQGLPPFGDERDDMTIADLLGKGAAPEPINPLAVDEGPDVEPGDAPPTDESASTLAAKMSEWKIARCEHGACNRCRLCGIERLRDFDPDRRGGVKWRVAWRPIVKSVPVIANGAASRPLLSAGGDA